MIRGEAGFTFQTSSYSLPLAGFCRCHRKHVIKADERPRNEFALLVHAHGVGFLPLPHVTFCHPASKVLGAAASSPKGPAMAVMEQTTTRFTASEVPERCWAEPSQQVHPQLPAASCSTKEKGAPPLPGASSTCPTPLLTCAFLLPCCKD